MKTKRRIRRGRSGGRAAETPLRIPDRRAMEKAFAEMHRLLRDREFGSIEEANAFLEAALAEKPIPPPPLTPVEQAQDIMYEAWGAQGKRRVELALKALQTSKDCADAYVLLAEDVAPTLDEAARLYEEGVRAGERALGPSAFEELAGHFWGVLETRPYMRARLGLAHCLWGQGKRQQAIGHYQEMLRLNPNDNQGIRYILATCLLEEGQDEALGRLVEEAEFKDDITADWVYTRALWLFRTEGENRRANAACRKALRANALVPAYLLKRRKLPRHLPETVGFGDETEAISYAANALRAWQTSPGALEWLARIAETRV